jgi:hypothetical protein
MSLLHSPKIVTNGLVLCFDAASRKSYPGTGSFLRDLSVNGKIGTLFNGLTFSTDNGGTFVFNGINHSIQILGSTESFYSEGTISFWMNSSNIVDYKSPFSTSAFSGKGISFIQTSASEFMILIFNDLGNAALHYYNTLDSPLFQNTWYNVVAVWNKSTNNIIGYLNGVQKFNSNNITWPTLLEIIRIGNGFGSFYFGGKISQTLMYNKALTSQEVQQNFNALRGRYGI